MGMLFSPVHLCLILLAEYYRANLDRVYREFLLTSLSLFSAGLAFLYLPRPLSKPIKITPVEVLVIG